MTTSGGAYYRLVGDVGRTFFERGYEKVLVSGKWSRGMIKPLVLTFKVHTYSRSCIVSLVPA